MVPCQRLPLVLSVCLSGGMCGVGYVRIIYVQVRPSAIIRKALTDSLIRQRYDSLVDGL